MCQSKVIHTKGWSKHDTDMEDHVLYKIHEHTHLPKAAATSLCDAAECTPQQAAGLLHRMDARHVSDHSQTNISSRLHSAVFVLMPSSRGSVLQTVAMMRRRNSLFVLLYCSLIYTTLYTSHEAVSEAATQTPDMHLWRMCNQY